MNKSAGIKEVITKKGLIPLLTSENIDITISFADIICKSGLKIIEYGIRNNNSLNNYVLLKNHIKSKYPDVFFGASSIVDQNTAKK